MTKTAINDRFFISHSLGYNHLGHNFESSKHGQVAEVESEASDNEEAPKRGAKKVKKIAMGDDLGSMNYMMGSARLEFLNIPLIKDLNNLRAFTYAELAFYPSLKIKGLLDPKIIKDNTRLSAGFGLCIPINPMISILLYYNALNFNS